MKKIVYKGMVIGLVCLISTSGAFAQEGDREERWDEAGRKIGEAVEDMGKKLEKTLTEAFDEEFQHEMTEAGREISLAMQSLTEEVTDMRDWHHGRHANNFDEEKSKKITRSFKVKASDQLSIENKFGQVHVNTWDKNEITVEVNMIGRANSADRAQQVLNAIDVKVTEENGVIAFKTDIGKTQSNNHNGKKGFEINYMVHMPRGNPLKLKNSFGDVYLAGLNGRADLNVSYGGLKAEKLNHTENFVKVAFGSGNIEYVKGGTLDIDYSKVNIERMDNVTVSSGFSKFSVEKAGNVDMKAKYGDVRIGTVDNLIGSAGYSGFDVDQVNEKINMKVQYCNDFDINGLSKNFKEVILDGSFSKIKLNFDPSASFNFDLNLQYADLDANNNLNNFTSVEKKSNSKIYKGNFGKGSGGNVKITSRYGDVDFKLND